MTLFVKHTLEIDPHTCVLFRMFSPREGWGGWELQRGKAGGFLIGNHKVFMHVNTLNASSSMMCPRLLLDMHYKWQPKAHDNKIPPQISHDDMESIISGSQNVGKLKAICYGSLTL